MALDLTAASAPQLLFDQLQPDGVLVEILVNNAGYGVSGEFAQMPEQEILGQIQLNISPLTLLTKLFLAPMFERGSGKIMNVARAHNARPPPRARCVSIHGINSEGRGGTFAVAVQYPPVIR